MRSRSLKPGFFKNEILGSNDPLYSILFEGLWCMADRDGRLEDRPLRICAEVFPYRRTVTERRCDTMLQWLHDEGFISRYEADGRRFIHILEFSKHQRPHQNETPSVIPAVSSTSAQPRRTTEVNQGASPGHNKVHPDSEKGNKHFALTPDSLFSDSGLLTPDSSLRESVSASPAAQPTTTAGGGKRKVSDRATRIPEDFSLTAERRLVAEAETLPAERTFEKFCNYWRAKSGSGARKTDWDATWKNWCMTEHDRNAGRVNGHSIAATAPPKRYRTADEIEAEELTREAANAQH